MPSSIDTLAKILAKAEATDNDAERDTFMAAAEARAAALGVDLAVARAHRADMERREEPEERQIKVGEFGLYHRALPANKHLVALISTIAGPHDVRMTIGAANVYVWAYGLPSDINIVEALYGMLSVHMIGEATAALRRGAARDRYMDGRVWRAHFYEGYVQRVGYRLWAVRDTALRDADVDNSGSTALVLRDKAEEVGAFFDAKHEHRKLGTWKAPRRDDYGGGASWEGAQAASVADLNLTTRMSSGAARGQL